MALRDRIVHWWASRVSQRLVMGQVPEGDDHCPEAQGAMLAAEAQHPRSAAELVAAADRLTQLDRVEEAFALRSQAIEQMSDDEHPDGAGPWRDQRLARQRYAAARDADRAATRHAELDDGMAIHWWRQAGAQLSLLGREAHDHESEALFLQQKILGEAASAHDRLARTANESDDSRQAIEDWQQCARLLTYLVREFGDQPSWVREMHLVALTSAGALVHRLAREGDAESPAALADWQVAVDLLGELLDHHRDLPHWVPKLHEQALRNAAIASRKQGERVVEGDPEAACLHLVQAVGFVDRLVKQYPEQPAWLPDYQRSLLGQAARLVFDFAEALDTAEGEDPDQRHLYRRQAEALMTRLLRTDPDGADWVRDCLDRIRFVPAAEVIDVSPSAGREPA